MTTVMVLPPKGNTKELPEKTTLGRKPMPMRFAESASQLIELIEVVVITEDMLKFEECLVLGL